eukprot:TRINITY_DN24971_c0_g1_i1.p1 TRINITY_DN24971_c0_g1~~TRINITY_DN24971_c0_g1_i1.p1  ORF type:complete len:1771 (-),score=316.59 TRINITY_DN24971_c0_g1_i1:142-5061(-)
MTPVRVPVRVPLSKAIPVLYSISPSTSAPAEPSSRGTFAERTIRMVNFPTSWITPSVVKSLNSRICSLLERFGELEEPPVLSSSIAGVTALNASARFTEKSAAILAYRSLNGLDNRTDLGNDAPRADVEAHAFVVQASPTVILAAACLPDLLSKVTCIELGDIPQDWSSKDVEELCSKHGFVKFVNPLSRNRFRVTFPAGNFAPTAALALSGHKVIAKSGMVATIRCKALPAEEGKAADDSPGKPESEESVCICVDEVQLATGDCSEEDREVFLTNLPAQDCCEEELRQWLVGFGEVEEIVFLKNPYTRVLSGSAYVRFSRHEEATSLLAAFPADSEEGNVQVYWSLSERLRQGLLGVLKADVLGSIRVRLEKLRVEANCVSLSIIGKGSRGWTAPGMLGDPTGPLRFAWLRVGNDEGTMARVKPQLEMVIAAELGKAHAQAKAYALAEHVSVVAEKFAKDDRLLWSDAASTGIVGDAAADDSDDGGRAAWNTVSSGRTAWSSRSTVRVDRGSADSASAHPNGNAPTPTTAFATSSEKARDASTSSSSSSEHKKRRKKEDAAEAHTTAAVDAGAAGGGNASGRTNFGASGDSVPGILMRGFPESWTAREVRLIFALFGDISSVTFLGDTGNRRAYVKLKKYWNTADVVKKLNNEQVGDGELIEKCTISCEVLDGIIQGDGGQHAFESGAREPSGSAIPSASAASGAEGEDRERDKGYFKYKDKDKDREYRREHKALKAARHAAAMGFGRYPAPPPSVYHNHHMPGPPFGPMGGCWPHVPPGHPGPFGAFPGGPFWPGAHASFVPPINAFSAAAAAAAAAVVGGGCGGHRSGGRHRDDGGRMSRGDMGGRDGRSGHGNRRRGSPHNDGGRGRRHRSRRSEENRSKKRQRSVGKAPDNSADRTVGRSGEARDSRSREKENADKKEAARQDDSSSAEEKCNTKEAADTKEDAPSNGSSSAEGSSEHGSDVEGGPQGDDIGVSSRSKEREADNEVAAEKGKTPPEDAPAPLDEDKPLVATSDGRPRAKARATVPPREEESADKANTSAEEDEDESAKEADVRVGGDDSADQATDRKLSQSLDDRQHRVGERDDSDHTEEERQSPERGADAQIGQRKEDHTGKRVKEETDDDDDTQVESVELKEGREKSASVPGERTQTDAGFAKQTRQDSPRAGVSLRERCQIRTSDDKTFAGTGISCKRLAAPQWHRRGVRSTSRQVTNREVGEGGSTSGNPNGDRMDGPDSSRHGGALESDHDDRVDREIAFGIELVKRAQSVPFTKERSVLEAAYKDYVTGLRYLTDRDKASPSAPSADEVFSYVAEAEKLKEHIDALAEGKDSAGKRSCSWSASRSPRPRTPRSGDVLASGNRRCHDNDRYGFAGRTRIYTRGRDHSGGAGDRHRHVETGTPGRSGPYERDGVGGFASTRSHGGGGTSGGWDTARQHSGGVETRARGSGGGAPREGGNLRGGGDSRGGGGESRGGGETRALGEARGGGDSRFGQSRDSGDSREVGEHRGGGESRSAVEFRGVGESRGGGESRGSGEFRGSGESRGGGKNSRSTTLRHGDGGSRGQSGSSGGGILSTRLRRNTPASGERSGGFRQSRSRSRRRGDSGRQYRSRSPLIHRDRAISPVHTEATRKVLLKPRR